MSSESREKGLSQLLPVKKTHLDVELIIKELKFKYIFNNQKDQTKRNCMY